MNAVCTSEDLPAHFNEPQKARILASVSYVDKLLVDVEEILTAASSQAFPKYKNPLTPIQVRIARDYIQRLRQQITHVLQTLEIELPAAKFDSTHAIRVTLQFVEVALEDIAPERLRGYGEVPTAFAARLAGGLQEMKGIVRQLDSYLVQRHDADLNARVTQLPGSDAANLISLVASILDRHGLVEFRIPLQQIIDKMEKPSYEIAFFGRVSAGKSSLLNCIIGDDLLPTGVTPVTAVPTRVRNRPAEALLVWTGDGRMNHYRIDKLSEFVTEQGNAENHKRVTRLIAEVPLSILPEEAVLVDTPGLGSLALEGAAETLAYLPHCDLGVVLVEASSNLHSDDVATLEALRSAGIPSLTVLSKADLVNAEDLDRLVRYTSRELAEQLGITIPVTPLSSHKDRTIGLRTWVEQQIVPRLANARRLAQQSDQCKAVILAERVLRALQMSIRSASAGPVGRSDVEIKRAETELLEAAALLERANEQCFCITAEIRNAGPHATVLLAEAAIAVWQNRQRVRQGSSPLDAEWFRNAVNAIAQKAAEELAAFIAGSAKKLSEALNAAALATATGQRSEQISFEGFVKELPAPDFGGGLVQFSRPRTLSISIRFSRWSVRNRIESECGTDLAAFFNAYGRSLELWFRTVLGSLEREFNSNADIYRAQLQRLSADDYSMNSSQSAVVGDIAALRMALGRSEILEQSEAPATL